MQVRGTGGEGSPRGCRAIRFEKGVLIVEGVAEGGNPSWKKTS